VPRLRHTVEQILAKLREAEVALVTVGVISSRLRSGFRAMRRTGDLQV